MKPHEPLTTRNLARLAWASGHRGVTGLAKAIGRHRVTLYQAIQSPEQHRPTVRAIKRALKR